MATKKEIPQLRREDLTDAQWDMCCTRLFPLLRRLKASAVARQAQKSA